ncbi:hypothetical protein SLEP1_g28729 [Rubroshorea leprosula]|uniref:Secreted protein n=1 Tax=Rubroshorea leprosula TaxID=152421 RepID=A0AAV5K117_9ROSI|nr:hypothetical protein SLEP1_g28729 [Rubroshorea leprosula]
MKSQSGGFLFPLALPRFLSGSLCTPVPDSPAEISLLIGEWSCSTGGCRLESRSVIAVCSVS